jgi:hypothetical protein
MQYFGSATHFRGLSWLGAANIRFVGKYMSGSAEIYIPI